MFLIFGGLPGVGKSTIAEKLAITLKAVYLRIDSIVQAIKNAAIEDNPLFSIHAEGYMTAYALAQDNLQLGLTVIADSVNSIEITRQGFRNVAVESNKPFIEIEIICSERAQHQYQISNRKSSIKGLQLPNWDEVKVRLYEMWDSADLVIDSAKYSPDEAVQHIIKFIDIYKTN